MCIKSKRFADLAGLQFGPQQTFPVPHIRKKTSKMCLGQCYSEHSHTGNYKFIPLSKHEVKVWNEKGFLPRGSFSFHLLIPYFDSYCPVKSLASNQIIFTCKNNQMIELVMFRVCSLGEKIIIQQGYIPKGIHLTDNMPISQTFFFFQARWFSITPAALYYSLMYMYFVIN